MRWPPSGTVDEPDAETVAGNEAAEAAKVKTEKTTRSPTERLDESHQQHLAQIDKHCDHFRKRSKRFESRALELLPRLAALEQAERTAKANLNLANIGMATAGILVSAASLFLSDATKWTVCCVGGAIFIYAIIQMQVINRTNWPRRNPLNMGDLNKTGARELPISKATP